VRAARRRARNALLFPRNPRSRREPKVFLRRQPLHERHRCGNLVQQRELAQCANHRGGTRPLGVRAVHHRTRGASKSVALNLPCSRTSQPCVSGRRYRRRQS